MLIPSWWVVIPFSRVVIPHVVGGNTPLRYVLILTSFVLILTCWNHLELLSIFSFAVLIMEDNLNTSELQSLMMEE